MRIPSPASRATRRLRFYGFDLFWAVMSPLLALYLGDAYVLRVENSGLEAVGLYCLVSAGCSIASFLIFEVERSVPRYFSVHDAINICKAVLLSEILSSWMLFSLTRLEGIPRSTPILHALILAAGLIGVRTCVRLLRGETIANGPNGCSPKCILLVGSNTYSALYVKLVRACAHDRKRVVALLDNRAEMFGRAIDGVRVVGSPCQIASIVDEYELHGIEIGEVVIAGEQGLLSNEEMRAVVQTCESRSIELGFIPQMLGLTGQDTRALEENEVIARPIAVPRYFRVKYVMDFVVSLVVLMCILPLLVGVGLVVLWDVGIPILFWQQRLGTGGRDFLLYKFRTMRTPFDSQGNPIRSQEKVSLLGRLLRDTSLDELPQLLNVLVGDMSLIGPRPLLPEDQPKNRTVRLSIRPGITGWAQVNGGKLLTAEDKEKLDEWYVRNASIFVDLKIVLKTLHMIFVGRAEEHIRVTASRQSVAVREGS